MVVNLTTTKRWLSTGFVTVYWLALPLLVLSLVVVVALWITDGDRFSVRGMPDWLVVGIVALLPFAVIARLIIHYRARKTAAAAPE